jgi:sulfide:quinone oxidoreductase
MPMAYEMREKARAEDQITVVSNAPVFPFHAVQPLGRRQLAHARRHLARHRTAAGAEEHRLHRGRRQARPPRAQRAGTERWPRTGIRLPDHRHRPKLAFDEVEGLGPKGHTSSICHVEHAVESGKAWDEFVKDPGPIVVGAVQGASCYGPAYEFAFIMDTDLKRRKIRDKVPMTFVTAEPYIGHLGLGGVGDSKGLMESAMRDRHVKWICNAKVTKVEAGKMFVTEHNDDGTVKKEHELPFKYSMMLPAFKGIDAVFGIEGLTNPRGFITIDAFQRNPKYNNIYAVGVCVAIPPVEATPVPTGTPKTGYMIESMVTATAHNIRAVMDGQEPDEKATWNAVCLADFGDTGAAFVALPQIPPRNVNWFKEGKWVHLAKVAFEKYFLRKMKKGTTEPLYEKMVLKAMGIAKLKA